MDDSNHQFYQRFSTERVLVALQDTPVVMISGPRQCGKTTMVRELLDDDRAYFTLDEDTALAAARDDPAGFVRGLDYATIDEVQRVPDLLRAIKKAVDEDRRPGRFLLTGSTNLLTLPQVSESLAGRMEVVQLLPLSQAEVRGSKPAFLERALVGELVKASESLIGDDLVQTILAGGYPEMLLRDESRRRAWARGYVQAIVQRDVRDVASVEKLDYLPRLLRVLALHSGRLTNFTQIGGQLGLDDKTARKYIAIFEQLYLIHRLEPWLRNRLKRLVKTPKLHFLDSGLLAALLGATKGRVAKDRSIFGPLLETFVFSEIMKQTAWLDEASTLHHYRDKDLNEVDIVIEGQDGSVVGIEVKAAASVNAGDFKGLRKLADACGDAFRLGIIFYDSETAVPFGTHLFAAPVGCLWGA
jgi:predicted AAA+ superfamily ATPase